MNRSWPFLQSSRQSGKSTWDVQSGQFTTSCQDTVHSLFAPLHYTPGYSYPLIVWLHGPGSDERHLVRVMPMVSMQNYLAVAPRGTLISVAGSPPMLEEEHFGWQQAEEQVQQAEQRIFDSIDIVAWKFHVHQRRIFLAGFDCGGTMAFRVAMNHPDRFAGVLSLGGEFPRGRAPLAKLTEARRLPVFLAAGRHSASYTPTAVCEDLRLLHAAGLSITLRQYPCGQELTPQMLGDMNRWIMEQINSTGVPTPESDVQQSHGVE
jgi:phospholipase/carboxylesterase